MWDEGQLLPMLDVLPRSKGLLRLDEMPTGYSDAYEIPDNLRYCADAMYPILMTLYLLSMLP